MQRLDEFVSRRRHLAARYNQLLSDFPLVLPWQHPDTESSWHLYVIRLKLDEIGKTHRQVFEELRQAEIGVNLHYIPVHTQPYYQNLGFKWGDFPQAEQYYQEAISLPIYYGLSDENQDQVGAVLRNILSEK
jgi:dTDP-4-amino-4,6-dideoxygalactose transaminase